MEIKKLSEDELQNLQYNCIESDFWYNLTAGGYVKPEEILKDPSDIITVRQAVRVIKDFYKAIENKLDEEDML